jgi:serine/threonine protein kinase
VEPLLRAACDAAGTDQPRLIHEFRGAASYRAGDWKIKTAVGDTSHLAHEAAVYELRQTQDLHPGVHHGHHEDGLWLAIPWEHGPTLWEAFAPVRDGQDAPTLRAMVLHAAQGTFAELNRWHRAGWLHGDVQPGNIVLGERATFIDMDHARHPDLPLPFPYRGGMDHATAPEVARQVIETPEDVDAGLDQAAEVYSLGVSIRWAWTGKLPTDYRAFGTAAPAELLADIADGRRRDLFEDRPYPFPELEELIEKSTRLDPEKRVMPIPVNR